MTFFHASNVASLSFLVLSHLILGMALGLVYFRTLWWNARLLAAGTSIPRALALMALRLALLAGVLVLTSREGALPLLVTMVGILAGRFVILRRMRTVSP